MSKLLTWIGGIGAALGVVCCVTPLLPAILTALGLSGWIGAVYRDAVILPFAALSVCLMIVGVWMKRRQL